MQDRSIRLTYNLGDNGIITPSYELQEYLVSSGKCLYIFAIYPISLAIDEK